MITTSLLLLHRLPPGQTRRKAGGKEAGGSPSRAPLATCRQVPGSPRCGVEVPSPRSPTSGQAKARARKAPRTPGRSRAACPASPPSAWDPGRHRPSSLHLWFRESRGARATVWGDATVRESLWGCAIVHERTGGARHFAHVSPLGKEVTSGACGVAARSRCTGTRGWGAATRQAFGDPEWARAHSGRWESGSQPQFSPLGPVLVRTSRRPFSRQAEPMGENLQSPPHPHAPPRAPCCSHRLLINQ